MACASSPGAAMVPFGADGRAGAKLPPCPPTALLAKLRRRPWIFTLAQTTAQHLLLAAEEVKVAPVTSSNKPSAP